MPQVATEQQRKNKYRELVDELEGKQRTWSKLEAALRGACSKLAIRAAAADDGAGRGVERRREAAVRDRGRGVSPSWRARERHGVGRAHGLRAPGDTPTTVYERADRALYQAKQQGRNRCLSS